MFVRKAINRSGNTSVQVVEKVGRRNIVVKHIGTARTPMEVSQLVERGRHYIASERIKSGVVSLFDTRFNTSTLKQTLSRFSFIKVLDTATYLFLSFYYHKLGFDDIGDDCFKDLVIARLVEPLSKRQTRVLLERRFGKTYSLPKIYRSLQQVFSFQYQQKTEEIVKRWIRGKGESITVIFFDVTTLYYEAFDEDDFRKYGFSKDGKHNQPQVVIGLVVTKSGLPLSLNVFEGSTFEGHTMLPSITKLMDRFNLEDIVIVADAAMLSTDNLRLIEEKRLKYIIGARLGNIKNDLFERVVATPKIDGASQRIPVDTDRILIVSYSNTRAVKDRRDREKQIEKAKAGINKRKALHRYKFLKLKGKNQYQLNIGLIEKATKLEGLKGYITNALALSTSEVIEKYSELWQVEKAFRMSKSDLKARPIFHTLKESIWAHLTIVFTALVVARQMELTTGKSIRFVINTLNQVKEVFVKDIVSEEIVSKFTEPTKEAEELLKQIHLDWVT